MQENIKRTEADSASVAAALSVISNEMEEVYGCVRDLRMVVKILETRLDENLFPGHSAVNLIEGGHGQDFFYFQPIEREMIGFLMFDSLERADKFDALAETLSNRLVFLAGDMRRAIASEGGVA